MSEAATWPVYVMSEKPLPGEVGPKVKVGRGIADAQAALRACQRGNPRELSIEFKTPPLTPKESGKIEATAQTWLHEYAIRGEWFSCDWELAKLAVERALHFLRHPEEVHHDMASWLFRPAAPSIIPKGPVHRKLASERANATRKANRAKSINQGATK